MALRAKEALPGFRGLAADGSSTAKRREAYFGAGITLINSLRHGKDGKYLSHRLGPMRFRGSSNGQVEELMVWTVDGQPCIEVHDGNEPVYLKLERGKHQPRRRKRGGRCILYAEWSAPKSPLAPSRPRNAKVWLRHNSTQAELDAGILVSRHLLLISPSDPLYDALYGRRELAESFNNNFKQRFINQRARSLGLPCRSLDVLGFVTVYNMESLAMWLKVTGADCSAWFGCYDPFT